jgi:hypothetical protein
VAAAKKRRNNLFSDARKIPSNTLLYNKWLRGKEAAVFSSTKNVSDEKVNPFDEYVNSE